MSAELEKKFVWLSKTFSGNFFALSTPHRFRLNSKENEKRVVVFFFTFLGLKYCVDVKGRRTMSRYQVVPFAILTNFGFNLAVKVCARENPYKNGEFLAGFQR